MAPSYPDLWLVLAALGILLIAAEFCFPGRVFFAAIGSVLTIGGFSRLIDYRAVGRWPHGWVAVPVTATAAIPLIWLWRVAAIGRARKRNTIS